MKVKSESEVAQSCPTLLDPMDAAFQAPPSMGFSRQEWNQEPVICLFSDLELLCNGNSCFPISLRFPGPLGYLIPLLWVYEC